MLGRTNNLRSARLRKKRRKAVIGKTIFAFFCLFDLWGGLFLFSGLPAVTVRNIEVSGAILVSTSEITGKVDKILGGRYFFTILRANALFYPKAAIERVVIEAFPRVERVTVGLKNFHTMEIQIAERQAAGLWCHSAAEPAAGSAACYLLDGNSLIFAPFSESASSSVAFIKFYSAAPKENPIGQTYAPPQFFQALLAFAKNLNALGFSVVSFQERTDADFEARLSGGQRLIFGRDADLVSVAGNFQTIISDQSWSGTGNFKKVDYMDTRFGNKVFYKLK